MLQVILFSKKLPGVSEGISGGMSSAKFEKSSASTVSGACECISLQESAHQVTLRTGSSGNSLLGLADLSQLIQPARLTPGPFWNPQTCSTDRVSSGKMECCNDASHFNPAEPLLQKLVILLKLRFGHLPQS